MQVRCRKSRSRVWMLRVPRWHEHRQQDSRAVHRCTHAPLPSILATHAPPSPPLAGQHESSLTLLGRAERLALSSLSASQREATTTFTRSHAARSRLLAVTLNNLACAYNECVATFVWCPCHGVIFMMRVCAPNEPAVLEVVVAHLLSSLCVVLVARAGRTAEAIKALQTALRLDGMWCGVVWCVAPHLCTFCYILMLWPRVPRGACAVSLFAGLPEWSSQEAETSATATGRVRTLLNLSALHTACGQHDLAMACRTQAADTLTHSPRPTAGAATVGF